VTTDLDELRTMMAERSGALPANPLRVEQVRGRVRRARRLRSVAAVAAAGAAVLVVLAVARPVVEHLSRPGPPAGRAAWPIQTRDGLFQYRDGMQLARTFVVTLDGRAGVRTVRIPVVPALAAQGWGWSIGCTTVSGVAPSGTQLRVSLAVDGRASGAQGCVLGQPGAAFDAGLTGAVTELTAQVGVTAPSGVAGAAVLPLPAGVTGRVTIGLYRPVPWSQYPVQPRPSTVDLTPLTDVVDPAAEAGQHVLAANATQLGATGVFVVGSVRVTAGLQPYVNLVVPGQLSVLLDGHPWLTCASYDYSVMSCLGLTVGAASGLPKVGQQATVTVVATHLQDPGWYVLLFQARP
jgi:hypothetical protein